MKTRFLAIPLLITIALSLVETTTVSDAPRGVAPSKAKAYLADKAGNWKCLDGSKTIKFAAINDDYCDCLDGSDEPGTSACGNGYYYCANTGHRAAYIKTSRINDGVCDPECCDGSDETDGQIHCPNICKQVGAEARKEHERVRAIEKEGSKLLQGYINYGKNAKKGLSAKVDKLKTEALTIKQKAETCKDALDKADAALQEQLESTKAEREAARKILLEPIIEQQYVRLSHAKGVRDRLRSALEHLKANSNKNYHDLVVKSTIAGYDEHVEELAKYNADRKPVDPSKVLTADETMLAAVDETYDMRKEIGGLYVLLKGMKEGYNTDNNDEAVLRAVMVFDEFTPKWQGDQNEFVDETPLEIPPENKETGSQQQDRGAFGSIIERLQKGARTIGLGFLVPETRSVKEIAQDAYNKASAEERRIENEIQDVERKLAMDYGKDERFAQLVDQCFEFKEIEYTYSVCLFGKAYQKSNSDTSLGTFSEWVGDNYDTQLYTGGVKCWNGPDRSVKVVMSCGTQNEIIAVSEPNKCEYLFKFRTPAACRLLDGSESTDENPEPTMPGEIPKKHDEL
ncbi:hypothetical protein CPB97_006337 [Podila verticillata]|nr:hypothetical protein CPB97_006337 [Podila verticillata]